MCGNAKTHKKNPITCLEKKVQVTGRIGIGRLSFNFFPVSDYKIF